MYQALYRKWRPRTFDDVVGQGHITETLKRQVQEGRLSHAYLFTGTRGTGKTSCAKILARAVNCEHPMNGNPCNQCAACRGIESGAVMDVLELDAASNNSVDQVRALRDEAVYSPAAVRKRVYIVDEVHMLSNSAFNALLKILEEPPAHLMFILATTELHKVPATIKSRCQQFSFKRLSPLEIGGRLKYVAGEENIPLTPEGASLIARLADGGMRDALSLLDQCSGEGGGSLGEKEILDALGLAGNVETAALMGEIAGRDAAAALERLDRLYAAGKDVGSLLGELSSLTRDLLIRRTAPRGGAGLLHGGYDEATIRGLAESLTTPRLARMLGWLQTTLSGLGRSADRRVDAELCLIRLCDETLDDSSAGLAARVAKLEDRLSGAALPSQSNPAEKAAPAPKGERTAPPAPDLPPWDGGTDPEPKPAADKTAPVSEPPAAKTEKSAPTPEPVVPPSNGHRDLGDFWRPLVTRLKGKVPMGEYNFLFMTKATVEGTGLIIWAETDFLKNMIDTPGVLAQVESEAARLPGGPYRATVRVGTPPAGGGKKKNSVDDLLSLGRQFGDIIIEE